MIYTLLFELPFFLGLENVEYLPFFYSLFKPLVENRLISLIKIGECYYVIFLFYSVLNK